MLFISLALSLLAISPAQGLTSRGDGASINAGLTTISNQLVKMNSTLNKFQGGLSGTLMALQIQGESLTLESNIKTATTTINKAAPLSDEDSTTIAFAIVSLSHNIYDVLDNLILKKPAFDNAILGVGSASLLVKLDLVNLKKATDTLGTGLTKKLTPKIADVAPLMISAIDHHFDQALTVYA